MQATAIRPTLTPGKQLTIVTICWCTIATAHPLNPTHRRPTSKDHLQRKTSLLLWSKIMQNDNHKAALLKISHSRSFQAKDSLSITPVLSNLGAHCHLSQGRLRIYPMAWRVQVGLSVAITGRKSSIPNAMIGLTQQSMKVRQLTRKLRKMKPFQTWQGHYWKSYQYARRSNCIKT